MYAYNFNIKAELIQALLNKVASPDSSPTAGSDGLVSSDGIYQSIKDFITKAVDDLVNYYTKSEVQDLISHIQQFHYEVYASISDVTNPQSNVLYLIGPTGTGSDKYEEYVWPDAQTGFVKIGDTSIDLSGYITTSALNTALADYTTTANLTTLLAGKQDTISDLAAIRSGAAAGATAYHKPSGGIPMIDLAYAVRISLNKANTALQTNFYEGDYAWSLGIKLGQEKATMLVEMREHFGDETQTGHYAELLVSTTSDNSYVKVLTFNGENILRFDIADNGEEKWLLIGGYDNDDFLSVDFYVTKISGTTPDIQCRSSDGWGYNYTVITYTGVISLYNKPLSGIPKSDLASAVQTSLGKADTSVQPAALKAVTDLIPAQASPSNQLADKNFVNSSIQTETATFKGNYDTWENVPDTGDAWENAPDNNDYLVVRDASNYAPIWDNNWAGISGYPGFIVGDIVTDYSETLETYVLCRCIADINYDEEPEESSPANNTTHFEIVTSNPNYEGTWRFKYPDSGDYDKYNWLPEYQVNEKPLTAAQLAALNSNITDTKVDKLDGLPTRAELTLEEQALDKIFIATKDVTTPAQVASARAAGKVVIVIEGNDTYMLSHEDNNEYFFSAFVASGTHYFLQLNKSTGAWSWNYSPLEKTSNKVTSLSPSSTDTEYPSAKCVWDLIGDVESLINAL